MKEREKNKESKIEKIRKNVKKFLKEKGKKEDIKKQ